MNIVCNVFNTEPVTHEIKLTCGREILQDFSGAIGYEKVRGSTEPTIDGECPSQDWLLEAGKKKISKSGGWSWATCTYSRPASSNLLKQIRAKDHILYYTGFNRYKAAEVEDMNGVMTKAVEADAVGFS